MSTYYVGTGIADVTDPAIGIGMQGMADPSQKVKGVDSHLYARAFVVRDQAQHYVGIVNADIWTGTHAVKVEVIKQLKSAGINHFTEDNLLISGTHTHSGPGGYSDYKLYEHTPGGFDPHTFDCVVKGMVKAIRNATENLAPGEIYVHTGEVPNCGGQRSVGAYLANPEAERKRYNADTDKEMLLLKFVAIENGKEVPIGVLNWYAIHPTDRGQSNTKISGDNKGYASMLFEKAMNTNYSAKKTFVAAFANSNCGDVSGNVDYGQRPAGGSIDIAHMQAHGTTQYTYAHSYFNAANEKLSGNIDYRHTRVNMSNITIAGTNKRTWPGGLGLAFAAGSTEDSIPRIGVAGVTFDSFNLREGLVEHDLTVGERSAQAVTIGGLTATFGTTEDKKEFVDGHLPKPLVLRSGITNPPVTPNIVPLQIIKLGTLAIVAIPAEITTMAGRRLRETVLNGLNGTGVSRVALATYANDYSQYITTEEEYRKQHYEGASTLFGPHTLAAYQQEFGKLATALKNGSSVADGPNQQGRSAPTSRRITIRNNATSTVSIEVYHQSDTVAGGAFDWMAVPLTTFSVPASSDYAYYMPGGASELKMQVNNSNWIQHIKLHNLVTIHGNKTGQVSAYQPRFL